MKVETHNHPTAISPTLEHQLASVVKFVTKGRRGTRFQAESRSGRIFRIQLKIPDYKQPWEEEFGKPDRIVSALDIAIEGPLGAAGFNNEFGRPNILGYFRTYEGLVPGPNGQETEATTSQL